MDILIKNNQFQLQKHKDGYLSLTWAEACKDIFTRELTDERKKIENLVAGESIEHMIIDISNCKYIDKDDVKWYPNLLLSQYDKTNIQHIAIVLPTTFKLEHTQNQIIDDESNLVVRFFITPDEAVEWFKTNKAYHA